LLRRAGLKTGRLAAESAPRRGHRGYWGPIGPCPRSVVARRRRPGPA